MPRQTRCFGWMIDWRGVSNPMVVAVAVAALISVAASPAAVWLRNRACCCFHSYPSVVVVADSSEVAPPRSCSGCAARTTSSVAVNSIGLLGPVF